MLSVLAGWSPPNRGRAAATWCRSWTSILANRARRRMTARPGAFGVLLGEQTNAPTVARDFAPFLLDGACRCSDQIAQGLPTDGRIPAKEPLQYSVHRLQTR